MEEPKKKSILDILFLSLGMFVFSFIILYVCMKRVINPGKKNFGKVLGKGTKRKQKRNIDVMSSNNSTVSIELSTAEMD
ncbi:hypothetical protein NEIG_01956 [Nematocida sp. ERTm5]|nr:hypothetical protein NEIRO02_0949 [Nematocida sp. AWRm79]KAI5183268.1 hypothetical protein NEIRO03_0881 [Nematocida sp. AWRm78]OAG33458.1 hypothetical protein NEIG_01956 [Nematocida sp. ERTm5]